MHSANSSLIHGKIANILFLYALSGTIAAVFGMGKTKFITIIMNNTIIKFVELLQKQMDCNIIIDIGSTGFEICRKIIHTISETKKLPYIFFL